MSPTSLLLLLLHSQKWYISPSSVGETPLVGMYVCVSLVWVVRYAPSPCLLLLLVGYRLQEYSSILLEKLVADVSCSLFLQGREGAARSVLLSSVSESVRDA